MNKKTIRIFSACHFTNTTRIRIISLRPTFWPSVFVLLYRIPKYL